MEPTIEPEFDRTAAVREKTRARLLGQTPRWYNPWVHLGSTAGIGVVVLIIAVLNLHDVRPVELLVIPAVFVIANAFEWYAHKMILHRRFWPFEVIYERHTPDHHAVYMDNDMDIRSTREFRLVLIPAAGVLGIVLIVAPLAYLFSRFFGANSGWLFLVTQSLYNTSYELTHLSYHLPADSFIGRRRLIQVLRAHHARHHDPRLMQKWNFNVTVPFFDWIMGTIAPRK